MIQRLRLYENEKAKGYDPGGNVYFLGIGGIGMSALARYFHERGITVSGYDKTRTALTRRLEEEGIAVHYSDDISKVDKSAKLVIRTPAVPSDLNEWKYLQSNGYEIVKRSEVLGRITAESFSIAVAGTHGKTTTSAMIAHILRHTGFGCNAFLGGIAANYNTNFWSSSRNVSVAEADEYDRSFLTLQPDIAVITSMDPDHLDIYGSEENLQQAFVDFSQRVKPGGCIFYQDGIPRSDAFSATKYAYSISSTSAPVHVRNIRVESGRYVFDAVLHDKEMQGLELEMGGKHNVGNALVAVAVANMLGIGEEKIKLALSAFKGVKRRFEIVLNNGKHVLIDDYAHHPAELRALLQGVRDLYPHMKLSIVFQPHLYSRTHHHADAFAAVLDEADEIVLLPIYPARELPMEGVSSETIALRMKQKAILLNMETLPKWVDDQQPELLVISGAGDVDTLVDPIKNILTKA